MNYAILDGHFMPLLLSHYERYLRTQSLERPVESLEVFNKLGAEMRNSAVAVLIASVLFGVQAQDRETKKTDQESAEEVCSKNADAELQTCVDETLKKWRDPSYKAEVKRAEDFAHAVFKKCKSLDSQKFQLCAKQEYPKFSPGKVYNLSDLVEAVAYMDNLNVSLSAGAIKKQKVLFQCQKMHIAEGTVQIGMTADMVKECGWGAPESINRTISKSSVREQWVYGVGQYLYFHNGVLDSIQD